jgi:DNA polymerase
MIRLDFETKSYADLKKVGNWVYSLHETTAVICLCWAYDDEELVYSWTPDRGITKDLLDLYEAIEDGELVEAHNVSFELAIWTNIMVARYRAPGLKLKQLRDTMAVAAYYALPAALDRLAKVLGLPGKDPEGSRLISKYSKLYLKTAKKVIPLEDMQKWIVYCKEDVREQRLISNYLGDLPEDEQETFLMDLEIETLGMRVDHAGIAAASRLVDQRAAELEMEFMKTTGVRPSQRDAVMRWFHDNGVKLENLQADYLEEVLEEWELPQGPARRALQIRLSVSKASTKKLDKMVGQSDGQGISRFQCRYHGAQTGRWTGQGWQPLNLNRGWEDSVPEDLVNNIMYGSPKLLDLIYGDAMKAVSWASRHWITARPQHVIRAGDFVSIEAVVLACLAGEDWKVDAFRNGVKIYEAMADKIYNLPPGTVTKKTHPNERQDGKTGELAFGYQGALNAWLNFDDSGRHTDERIIEICKAWRKEHPASVNYWYDMERAAIKAVETGREVECRDISFKMTDEWLAMRLPDGKRIWYWAPELRLTMPSWHQPGIKEKCSNGTCDCEPKPQLTYMAQKFGAWRRVSTYGGKLVENATQATARQILVPAMKRVRRHGYPIILSVYDEVVCDVPKGHGTLKEFEEILGEREGFFRDWPIGVDCWEGERYRK